MLRAFKRREPPHWHPVQTYLRQGKIIGWRYGLIGRWLEPTGAPRWAKPLGAGHERRARNGTAVRTVWIWR